MRREWENMREEHNSLPEMPYDIRAHEKEWQRRGEWFDDDDDLMEQVNVVECRVFLGWLKNPIQFMMWSGEYSPHGFHLQAYCMWRFSSLVCLYHPTASFII